MPIFGSDIPGYVKDPKYREALEELERIVLGEKRNNRQPRQSHEHIATSRNGRVGCPLYPMAVIRSHRI